MDEREDPRARLRALGAERRCAAPDLEERLLHRVLGVPLVAQHPQRQPVRDAADAVVELGQRVLVAARDERDQGFVGEMSVVLAHGEAVRAARPTLTRANA